VWGGHSCPPTSTMKRIKPATNQPLSGIRVLVGRARHQAGALSAELRRLGAQVIEIPFIEIRRPRSFQPLDDALRSLSRYDWLILTSANGVEAMWERMDKLQLTRAQRNREGHGFALATKNDREGHELGRAESAGQLRFVLGHRFSRAATRQDKLRALAPAGRRLHIAAIGPATRRAIEQRGLAVDVVPKEYVAESVVRSLRSKVKGRRVLLVRAKVARDVIPRELRKAGARVDVVEAYETVVPQSSRRRLQDALNDPQRRPHVVTFTSSSTVRNFVELLGGSEPTARKRRSRGRVARAHTTSLRGRVAHTHTSRNGVLMASIGPITSSTLREFGLPVDIEAREFTIPGLVEAIVRRFAERR
jgi:uroporphyrinogen-III synthase